MDHVTSMSTARLARPRTSTRILIEPVIERADAIADHVRKDLPDHDGLQLVADGVASTAREAGRLSTALRKPWAPHRLPVIVVLLLVGALLAWLYFEFLYVSKLRIAIPVRDAELVQSRVADRGRLRFESVSTTGSRESLDRLIAGQVDLAFIQGGFDVPAELPRVEVPAGETLLFFVRDRVQGPNDVRIVVTSEPDQGSHTVAQRFFPLWHPSSTIEYRHTWRDLTGPAGPITAPDEDVDAIFVVKDLTDEKTLAAIAFLNSSGFHLADAQLGVRARRLDALRPIALETGAILTDPVVPTEPLRTYEVATYLVARKGLTPRLLAEAAHLLDPPPESLADAGFEPGWGLFKEVFEGLEAVVSIVIYLGVAFLALLGLEILSYRRRFNELNSLVSLISMFQSNKDVLDESDPARLRELLLYLSLCSDLLGLIGVITGYYGQENPSLLYHRVMDIIHERTNALKLNIQLKILHAGITIPPETSSARPGVDGHASGPATAKIVGAPVKSVGPT